MAIEKQRRAFISYSRTNKEFATKLTKGLRSEGFPVWFDLLDIPTGARWDDEVEKALRECSIFMVILTPASIASENVKDEIGYAIDHGKRILPVLLEDCDVPLRLRRFQYVDFTTKSFEEGFESAKELLGDLVEEASVPIPTKTRVVEDQLENNAERLARQKAEDERLAIAKVEAERKAKEDLDRLAAQKVEAERQAKEKVIAAEIKAESTVIAQKKPASKVMMYGIVGVVAFAIIGISLSALTNGGNKNPPVLAPTVEEVVSPATKIPTRVPTKTPTLIPTATGLVDVFDDNSNEWNTGLTNVGFFSVADGHYIWDVKWSGSESDAWQFYKKDASYENFEVSVDAKRVGGAPGSLCYGITLRSTIKGFNGIVGEGVGRYYELEVCDDQTYIIDYYNGSDWIYQVEFEHSDAIKKGDWNTLKVKANGAQFEYYINGVLVGKYTDSNLAQGNIGLAAYSYNGSSGQGEIWFDNFSLTEN